MQNTTTNNIFQLPATIPSLYNPAILADPDFVSGFQSGIEAYEAQCEDDGRKLTPQEVCADIRRNLDPRLLAHSHAVLQYFGHPDCPLFDAGFMAGWIYAHLFTPETSVPTSLEPHRKGVIIPIRVQ